MACYFFETPLGSLASNCNFAFSSVNIFELMAEEKKLNEDMTKLLPKLVCKCESKIEALNHEYSSMTIEDSNYHAEKRRHHSNHDD